MRSVVENERGKDSFESRLLKVIINQNGGTWPQFCKY